MSNFIEWETVPKIPSLSKEKTNTAKVTEKKQVEKSLPTYEKKTNSYTWAKDKPRISTLCEADKKMIAKQGLKLFIATELKILWSNEVGSTIASKTLKEKGMYYCGIRTVKKYYSIFYLNHL